MLRKLLLLSLVVVVGGCWVGCRARPTQPSFTLYVYTASWCEQCNKEKPLVRRLASRSNVTVKWRDWNAAQRRGAKALPYYVLVEDGKVVVKTYHIGTVRRRL